VKLDSNSNSDAAAAADKLRTQFGISKLDTVIANAGIGKDWNLVEHAPVAEVEDHFKTNAVGPFTLYQAMRSLLLEAPKPRFVVISTVLGSIGDQGNRPIPDVAYGMSKAAANFFVGKVHHEEPRIISFPIHPG
jgi:norsolorinic acid ketoreductase